MSDLLIYFKSLNNDLLSQQLELHIINLMQNPILQLTDFENKNRNTCTAF